MKYIYQKILLLAIILLLFSCQQPHRNNSSIFVSILPQKFFVEKIAGKKFQVDVLVQPGMSPATYEPLPRQMARLAKADLFFRIGVPFENSWIDKIAENHPDLKIIDTRKNIKLRDVETIEELLDETKTDHDHDAHNHAAGDPHIWLDPELVKIQAQTICESLIKADPENELFYRENYLSFAGELDSVSNEIESILKNSIGDKILVFHPSWGYFTDRYGLKQIAVEIEGKEPAPSQLAKIVSLIKKQNIKTVFVQKQFSAASIEAIAREIDAQIISIDPLSEDYLENLILIARTISENK